MCDMKCRLSFIIYFNKLPQKCSKHLDNLFKNFFKDEKKQIMLTFVKRKALKYLKEVLKRAKLKKHRLKYKITKNFLKYLSLDT